MTYAANSEDRQRIELMSSEVASPRSVTALSSAEVTFFSMLANSICLTPLWGFIASDYLSFMEFAVENASRLLLEEFAKIKGNGVLLSYNPSDLYMERFKMHVAGYEGMTGSSRYFFSTVPQALWDIANDRWLLQNLFISEGAVRYLHNAHMFLVLLGTGSGGSNPTFGSVEHVHQYLNSAASHWELICQGEGSETLLQQGLRSTIGADDLFRQGVTYLSSVIGLLYHDVSGQKTVRIKDGYLARVLFECWMASNGDKCGHQACTTLADLLSYSPSSDAAEFTRTNIIEPRRANDFVSTWISTVTQPIVNERLSVALNFMATFWGLREIEGTELFSLIRDHVPAILPLACKRQLCSGGPDPETNMKALTDGIRFMIFLLCHPSRGIESSFNLIVQSCLIPIISKSLLWFASCNPEEHRDKLFLANLVAITDFTHALLVDNEISGAALESTVKLRRTMSANWEPTLNRLRGLSRSRYPSRDMVLMAWQLLGGSLFTILNGALNQDQDQEPPQADEVTERPLEYCHYKDCLCYHSSVLHKLSTCGGCRRVTYCNATCQKKDWKAGHRNSCRLESSTESK